MSQEEYIGLESSTISAAVVDAGGELLMECFPRHPFIELVFPCAGGAVIVRKITDTPRLL